MKRPNPACSLVRASERLAERKAAVLNMRVQRLGAPAQQIRELDGARALVLGTDVDPRDLVAVSRLMTIALLGDLSNLPAEQAPSAIHGILMDAIAHGYHARLLEQESEVSA